MILLIHLLLIEQDHVSQTEAGALGFGYQSRRALPENLLSFAMAPRAIFRCFPLVNCLTLLGESRWVKSQMRPFSY